METLQNEQDKRVHIQFDDEETKLIDKNIKSIIFNMTRKVKQTEENIKKLSKISLLNISDKSIKENMKVNLAEKLRDFTNKLRKNEAEYMKKCDNYIDGYGQEEEDKEKSFGFDDINKDDEEMVQRYAENKLLRKRDQDINNLLSSINELTEIFKDMQVIVQHQGTILDRIDYNIDTAVDNTEQAHKQLVKAEENMKNDCMRNAILTLLIINFVFAIMLTYKFFG